MNKKFQPGSITITILLTLVFIILKKLNIITISWLWVLSPLWITTIVYIVFLVFLLAVLGVIYLMSTL